MLSVGWLIFGLYTFFSINHSNTADAFIGILIFAVILIFALIHWKISNNILGILREKFLVACSFINFIILFILAFLAKTCGGGEGCMVILIPYSLIMISSFFTLLLGIMCVFKINKKIVFWIFFLIILAISFYFYWGSFIQTPFIR